MAKLSQVDKVMAGMVEEAKARVAAIEEAHKKEAKSNKRDYSPLSDDQKRSIVHEVWDATDTGKLIQAAMEDVGEAIGL